MISSVIDRIRKTAGKQGQTCDVPGRADVLQMLAPRFKVSSSFTLSVEELALALDLSCSNASLPTTERNAS